MKSGEFYFLKDSYFEKFSEEPLMRNHEIIDGVPHNRPYFYAFQDNDSEIMWMIPVSSREDKFERLIKEKKKKYGHCDTIIPGEFLGKRSYFLIQNMCPATQQWVDEIYIDKVTNKPAHINQTFEKNLIKTARSVLSRSKHHKSILFADVDRMKSVLLAEIEETEKELDVVKAKLEELEADLESVAVSSETLS